MNESFLQAFRTKLFANPSLTPGGSLGVTGIWEEVAPAGEATPYIIFDLMADTDVYQFGSRAYRDLIVLVKCYVSGNETTGVDSAAAEQLAYEVDNTLHFNSLTVDGMPTIMLTRRSWAKGRDPDEAGITYLWRGGIYDVRRRP